MKRNIFIGFAVLLIGLTSCTKKIVPPPAAPPEPVATKLDSISYHIGYDFVKGYMKRGLKVEEKAFNDGVRDALENLDHKYDAKAMNKEVGLYLKEIKRKKAEKNLADEKAFLEQNKAKEGVFTTPSGLQYEIIKEGSGEKPALTDKVTVHYRGKLINGEEFDSSYSRNEPTTFKLNYVIKGWQEALQLMPKGSTYKFYIPSALAYGKRGNPAIEPNSLLIFDIELLDFEK